LKKKIEPVVTEPGSSAQNKTGTWRTKRPVLDNQKCVRCGICWTFCPDSCYELKQETERTDVHHRFVPNLDYCKGCGICEKECPFKAIKMVEEK
jgi:pyruvate ferredoxin oxidoreductase delta subunit